MADAAERDGRLRKYVSRLRMGVHREVVQAEEEHLLPAEL